jgi:nicotinate dehydrogenase large molybdopterin subunit
MEAKVLEQIFNLMKHIKITVNNQDYELLVNEHDMLSDVLRNNIGLTGTKIGCEQGSCGACTVILENDTVLSCITPILKADGLHIKTIESLTEDNSLHKLQEKFVEKGAIQCGFCTPGMVMTALNFVDDNTNTTKEDIQEAISGNLCRCTGYKKIIEAIADYANEETTKPNKKIGVGHGIPNIEAIKKVKGIAEYADDIKVKNALHCKFLRSPHAHALINNIDISLALKLPGVKSICVGKDLPNKFGVLPISQDETAMAIEKTRYAGEIVAAVAANTEEIAKQACKLIKVDYTPIRPYFKISESLNDIGSDEKIHEHTKFNNNIHKKAELRFGNQQQALEEADIRLKRSYNFEGVTHAFTEPHAATAWFDEDGLTIITATQVPHYLHRALAKVLELPLNKVRVIKPYVGGGFGGKSDPFPHEMLISYLAKKRANQ